MSRPASILFVTLIAACGASGASAGDAGTEAGGAAANVGTPCTPPEERQPSFTGYSEAQVTVGLDNPECGGAACLINHFRGRVSCPFGHDKNGAAPAGASPCTVTGSKEVVAGAVPAQCVDRDAEKAVYCSCRCANTFDQTNDGATCCACPNGFTCSQLVASLGPPNALSGAFCIKTGTAYDRASACTSSCSPGGSCK